MELEEEKSNIPIFDSAAEPNTSSTIPPTQPTSISSDSMDTTLPPDSDSTLSRGQKRKLTKAAKRAEWKLQKKVKREQAQSSERKDGDLEEEDESTPTSSRLAHQQQHPNGTQKRTGAVTDESMSESAYYFRESNRFVYPYWYEFSTYAKRRWLGQSIIQVLKTEYGNGGKGTNEDETESYYRTAITTGAFRIDGRMISCDYRLSEGDHLQHYQHRHETPVTSDPILIRYQDANIVVIDKPSSIPIHPCGNYRHNTVLFILAKEHNLRSLFVVHRLDAVTSGLLILAKNASTARRLSQQISDKEVRKEYVARVQGHFPEEMKNFVLSAPIYQYTTNGRTILSTAPPPTTIASPNTSIQPPPSTASARPKSDQIPDPFKESITVFTFLAYDPTSDTSLVKCCPLTGRTHQIRLHLAHIGYPIANDVRYGGRDATTGRTNNLAQVSTPPTASTTSESNSIDTNQASSLIAAPASTFSYDATTYWSNPSGRKKQLSLEIESERQLRIEAESQDHSGSCPICASQLKPSSSLDATDANLPSAPSTASTSSVQSLMELAADDDSSSPFSSTRIRVEYIWLHAYKYSYDPSFKRQTITQIPTDVPTNDSNPTATTTSSSVAIAHTTNPSDSIESSPSPTLIVSDPNISSQTTVTSSSIIPLPSSSDSSGPVASHPSPSPSPLHPSWLYEIPWPTWATELTHH